MGNLNKLSDAFAARSASNLTCSQVIQSNVVSSLVALRGTGGVAVGRLYGFDEEDRPLVTRLPGRPGEIVVARTTVGLQRSMIGADLIVLSIDAEIDAPIILGAIRTRAGADELSTAVPAATLEVDGERQLITAEREIVLRCGEASITLTRAGKVLIKGSYVLSRSTGKNRIVGASVDIN